MIDRDEQLPWIINQRLGSLSHLTCSLLCVCIGRAHGSSFICLHRLSSALHCIIVHSFCAWGLIGFARKLCLRLLSPMHRVLVMLLVRF
jgi:hypothetical protein